MLVQQLEERIVKGTMYNLLSFDVLSRDTLSANSASKVSKITSLVSTVFAKANLEKAFSSYLKTGF